MRGAFPTSALSLMLFILQLDQRNVYNQLAPSFFSKVLILNILFRQPSKKELSIFVICKNNFECSKPMEPFCSRIPWELGDSD